MAALVIKVATDSEGGIPQDTVETLLSKSAEGKELAVFADDGSIIFVHDEHDFEEV